MGSRSRVVRGSVFGGKRGFASKAITYFLAFTLIFVFTPGMFSGSSESAMVDSVYAESENGEGTTPPAGSEVPTPEPVPDSEVQSLGMDIVPMSLTGYPFGGGTYNLLTTMTNASGGSVDPLAPGYKPPNNGEVTLKFSVNPQNETNDTFAKYVIEQSKATNKEYVEIRINKQFFPGATSGVPLENATAEGLGFVFMSTPNGPPAATIPMNRIDGDFFVYRLYVNSTDAAINFYTGTGGSGGGSFNAAALNVTGKINVDGWNTGNLIEIIDSGSNSHDVIAFPYIPTPKTSVSATKSWIDHNDRDKIRKAAEFTLTGTDIKGNVVFGPNTKTVAVDATGAALTVTWSNLERATKDGNITYIVTEAPMAGYATTVSPTNASVVGVASGTVTFTNKHIPVTEIEVEKKWAGESGDRSNHDEKVVLTLQRRTGTTGQWSNVTTHTINKGDLLKHKFTNLPTINDSGAVYNYQVIETAIPGFTIGYTGQGTDNVVVTNTKVGTRDIEVEKKWAGETGDRSNHDEKVVLTLQRRIGTTGQWSNVTTHTINKGDLLKHKFEGLATTNDSGAEYNYQVIETAIPGYTIGYTGQGTNSIVITNTKVPTKDIEVEKKWAGETGDRSNHDEEVILTLQRRTGTTGQWSNVTTHTIKKGDLLKYKFENLPATNDSGTTYNYQVIETAIPGYTIGYTGQGTNSIVVTNTKVPTINIPGIKIWDHSDNANQAVVAIDIFLVGKDPSGTTVVPQQKITIKPGDDLNFVFSNLKTTTDSGQKITYTITESTVNGYTTSIVWKDANDYSKGITITNKRIKNIDIDVEKVWAGETGDRSNHDENVILKLQRRTGNGSWSDVAGYTVTIEKGDLLKHKFVGLPATNETNTTYSYQVIETAIPGYTIGYTGNATDGFVVTNTKVGTRDIEVEKVWDGEGSTTNTHDEEITLTLQRRTGTTGQWSNVTTHTIKKGDLLKHKFENLPTTNDSGTTYNYQVVETAIPGYTIGYKDQGTSNIVVTNTPIKGFAIKVSKVWVDNDNEDGVRQDVEITLTGRIGTTVVYSPNTKTIEKGADPQEYIFTDLPETNEAGTKIVYTVTEKKIEGYNAGVVTGNATDGFVVTNTKSSSTGMDPLEKSILPGSDKNKSTDANSRDGWVYFNRLLTQAYPVGGITIGEGQALWESFSTVDSNGILANPAGRNFITYELAVNYDSSKGTILHINGTEIENPSTVTELIPEGLKLLEVNNRAGIFITRYDGEPRTLNANGSLNMPSGSNTDNISGSITDGPAIASFGSSPRGMANYGLSIDYGKDTKGKDNIVFSFGKAPEIYADNPQYNNNNVAYKINLVFELDKDALGYNPNNPTTLSYVINNEALIKSHKQTGTIDEGDSASTTWFVGSSAESSRKLNWDYNRGVYTDNPTLVLPGESGYPSVHDGAIDLRYAIKTTGFGAQLIERGTIVDFNRDGGKLVHSEDGSFNPYFTKNGETTLLPDADIKWRLDSARTDGSEFALVPTAPYGKEKESTVHDYHYAMRYAAVNWQFGSILENAVGSSSQFTLIPLKLEMFKTDAVTGEPLDGYEFELFYADKNAKGEDVAVPNAQGSPVKFTENNKAVFFLPGTADDPQSGYTNTSKTRADVALKLVETKAPDGYERNDGNEYPLTFTMENGKASLTSESFVFGENNIKGHYTANVKNSSIEIGTTAVDGFDADKYVTPDADGEVTIIDTIDYVGLDITREYTLVGKLMYTDGTTATELVGADGKAVTAINVFTPETPDGQEIMEFTFRIGEQDFAGKSIVVYELLFEGDLEGLYDDNGYNIPEEDGEPVAIHEDPTSDEQTVYFPEITTNAYEDDDEKDSIVDPTEEVTITDKVSFKGLLAGVEYTLTGALHKQTVNKDTGDIIDGGILKDAQDNDIESTIVFKIGTDGKVYNTNNNDIVIGTANPTDDSKAYDGFVIMSFTIDATMLAGQKLVVFEEVTLDGLTVAIHADIEAESQTITVENNRSLGTTAADATDGDQYITPAIDDSDETKSTVSIIDTVSFEGLERNKEYTLVGKLVKADGSDFRIGTPLKSVINAVVFKPSELDEESTPKGTVNGDGPLVSGTVEVPFTFTLTESEKQDLTGGKLVVFEKLFEGDITAKVDREGYEPSHETPVASHEDETDDNQSLYFPEIATDAYEGNDPTDNVIAPEEDVTITDKVDFWGLVPGKTYTLEGTLMVKDGSETGAVLIGEDDQPIESSVTFTLDDDSTDILVDGDVVGQYEMDKGLASGSVYMTFTFDASLLAGKTIVVFEDLYHEYPQPGNKTKIATHSDIDDEDQSVTVDAKISTVAKDEDGDDYVTPDADGKVTIIDTVEYFGLVVGETYTLVGKLVLVDVDGNGVDFKVGNEETLVTSSKTFEAESVDGKVEMPFTFNINDLTLDQKTALYGGKLVVFEELFMGDNPALEEDGYTPIVDVDDDEEGNGDEEGNEGGDDKGPIAIHEDQNDEGQTIYFPEIATRAYEKIDIVEGEEVLDKEFDPVSSITITDSVMFKGLVPGKEYTLEGTLMLKEGPDDNKGTELLDRNGNSITSSVTFTLNTDQERNIWVGNKSVGTYVLGDNGLASGIVDMEFTLDASRLSGATIVVFEDLFHVDPLTGIKAKIAEHADINDEDQTVIVINISCEVDKDTIKRTSAAYNGLEKENIQNVGAEQYRYDLNFRSTSNTHGDYFWVDDPLENVALRHIKVDELWTPVVWGDIDGKFNVLYKTNKSGNTSYIADDSDAPYSNAGFRYWIKDADPTVRHRLQINGTINSISLAADEYITYVRYEYGAVKAGFTSKNNSHKSLNGEHRDNNSDELKLPPGTENTHLIPDLPNLSAMGFFSPLAEAARNNTNANNATDDSNSGGILAAFGSSYDGSIVALASGISPAGDVDWRPHASHDSHQDNAGTLKGASYLVSALGHMENVDIVSSVSAHIYREGMYDHDQDAVVTKQINTFVSSPTPLDVDNLVGPDSFLEKAKSNNLNLIGNKLVPSGKYYKTGDTAILGVWIILFIVGLTFTVLLLLTYRRNEKKVSKANGGAK